MIVDVKLCGTKIYGLSQNGHKFRSFFACSKVISTFFTHIRVFFIDNSIIICSIKVKCVFLDIQMLTYTTQNSKEPLLLTLSS